MRELDLAREAPKEKEERQGNRERERDGERDQERVRLMAEKREVGQTQSQRPKSPMKWRLKSRKTVPGDRDWMGWGCARGRQRG